MIDHLWQSTLFAAAIALLTLAFRGARASARFGLWLAASIKFLIPFAALTAIGAQLAPRRASPVQPALANVLETLAVPFPTPLASPAAASTDASLLQYLPTLFVVLWACGSISLLLVWLRRWRRIATVVRQASAADAGPVYDALSRVEQRIRRQARQHDSVRSAIQLRLSDASFEPGIFGLVRPVLLWPRPLDAHVTDAQIEAIVAHEVAHVRRRDNLTATMHMLVQAAFWFHPLVWWIGARLIDERERACDEAVLRLGSRPDVYAESILKTCRFSLESPLACVAGVTGSDLKKRIENVMRGEVRPSMGTWRKLLLGGMGAAAVIGPLTIGALTAPRLLAQIPVEADDRGLSFDAAAIARNRSGDFAVQIEIVPGGSFRATNVPLRTLIRYAFRLQDFALSGGPAWVGSDRFDVNAKGATASPDEFRLMVRTLLADRFRLRMHKEVRELSLYGLVVVNKDDARLRPTTEDCTRAQAPPPGVPDRASAPRCGYIGPAKGIELADGRSYMSFRGLTIDRLATVLEGPARRGVVDRTGLTGYFDGDFEFTAEFGPPPPPPGIADPLDRPSLRSLFTVLPEQLGLKLEPERGPVEVLVIDSVEPPTEN